MKTRHTFKVLSKKEVEKNRSSKYRYLKQEKLNSEKLILKYK